MAKNNVIITFSDEKYGDFLTDNWLASLKDNVSLKDTDVVVLDYGLNDMQKSKLKIAGVKVIKCNLDGSIVTIRFKDISNFLKKNKGYKQVMSCDGGDIIFQTDISPLFSKDKIFFRAACEHYPPRFNEMASLQRSIDADLMGRIKDETAGKKMINAGMLIGPRDKFIALCDFCCKNIIDKKSFGPDQVVINYFLHKNGFVELDGGYNFIIYTTKEKFKIKDGKFFYKSGILVPIVHNAGRISFIRAIDNFGYGPGHNRLKTLKFYVFRSLFLLLHKIYHKEKD